MAWVAYVGPFLFPWGQPGSRRVYGIARAISDAGYKVVVGSGQWGDRQTARADDLSDIEFTSLGDSPPKNGTVASKLKQFFYESGIKTVQWLEQCPTKPSHVFVYGAGAPFMSRVSRWCRKNRVPLVADVVEWYDGSHMPGGVLGPFSINAKIAFHYYFNRCDGVVAISSYLKKYFDNSVENVILIPPTIDLSRDGGGEFRLKHNAPLNLIYAGTPGKKDLLGSVIEAVARVDESGKKLRLRVLGPNSAQVSAMLQRTQIPQSVEVLGRVPQNDVSKLLREADFSVLLREPLRFAHAGFSTKFVESYAHGVPVIANLTSDIGQYLHDGVEGFVCRDCSVAALVEVLEKALQCSDQNISEMRHNAFQQAVSHFDYRVYVEEMGIFLERLSKRI